MSTETNIAQWIFSINSQRGDKLAVVDADHALTYSELELASRRFARTLQQYDLRPGERVLLQMPDGVDWPVAFFGLVLLGLNPVLISPDVNLANLQSVIDKSDAQAIISPKAPAGVIHIPANTVMTECVPWLDTYQFHDDEPCLWLLSSGTTGEPKCVIHRHASLRHLANYLAPHGFLVTENTRMLCTGKLSWTYGFNTSITVVLSQGATAYLIKGTPAPSRVFDMCHEHDITHLASVPAVLASMIKYPGILPDSMEYVFTSGERMPDFLLQQFYNVYGFQLIDTIGQSETMQTIALQWLPVGDLPGKRLTLPSITVELRDAQSQPVPPGIMGEMWVKTPCAALGYHKDWQKSKNTFQGEWVRMGDMMIQDEHGVYEYQGRSDDLIKIKGLWVSNIEIENEIMRDDNISDCAVIELPNSMGLNEIHAYVIADAPQHDIRQRLRSRLAPHKVPQHFHWVDSIPKTVTNKSRRSVLRDQTRLTNNSL